ncbi:MAG: hypothetical protein IK081_03715 [Lachnospiraceae bacterium]|nr:hypothetical protein [Lachnospiraceae bacterium]
MKKATIVSMAICLSLMAAGCAGDQQNPASEQQASKDTVVTSEVASSEAASSEESSSEVASSEATSSEASSEAASSEVAPTEESSSEAATPENVTYEVVTDTHKVTIEVVTVKTISECSSVIPKLTVDGKEATEVNAFLGNYVQENYPLEENGDYADGYTTQVVWGVKDNTVSFVIYASATNEDYYTCEAFNYDLDSLAALEDGEVTKRFGMTDEEFFSKTTDAVKDFCDGKDYYDLKKSIKTVNYDKFTPIVLNDGTLGAVGPIFYSDGQQFAGDENMRLFDLKATE